jgi:hypothetical protein
VALTRARLEALKTDPQDIYTTVHGLVLRALDGDRVAETAPGLAALQAAVDAVHGGRIARTLLAPRLVHYQLPEPAIDSRPAARAGQPRARVGPAAAPRPVAAGR